MAFKETFETTREAEREVQNTITYLKEHSYLSAKYVSTENYIKSYKEELGIEGELKWLRDFLESEKQECEDELRRFKESISTEGLKIKCRQIENAMKSCFSDDAEDYGDDD